MLMNPGSGSSLLLELFLALTKYTTNNKIRFAWWGAEERGLIGSRYYVNNLGAAESASILAYLNFDMVSRGYYGVFDGDGASYGVAAPPGSDVIQDLFTEEFVAKGINVTAARFTNGSDYASFWQVLNKPIGGLHTGTGYAQDPCYHDVCDNINNPDVDQLTVNAKASSETMTEGYATETLLLTMVFFLYADYCPRSCEPGRGRHQPHQETEPSRTLRPLGRNWQRNCNRGRIR